MFTITIKLPKIPALPRLGPNRLKHWVAQYVEEKRKVYPTSTDWHEEYLRIFMGICNKHITEICVEDLAAYAVEIRKTHNSQFLRARGLRAVNSFLRFWRARGHRYLPQLTCSDYERLS